MLYPTSKTARIEDASRSISYFLPLTAYSLSHIMKHLAHIFILLQSLNKF